MSDPPSTNAAVERQRAGFATLNSLSEPPTDLASSVSEGFRYEDHRSGGVSFGHLDAAGWAEFLQSVWGLRQSRPHRSVREVIATRGQRLAAVTARIDYGDDTLNEFIICLRLDADLERMEWVAHFDLEEVRAAVAELDRHNAEIEAEHSGT